jgi:hypothetical protein
MLSPKSHDPSSLSPKSSYGASSNSPLAVTGREALA